MSLSAWLWGTPQVDEAVDKATSELLPAGTEDIALNLEICDQIRSKSVQPKDAMRALKRRLNHKNPNVQLLALSLTDICIKNGGDHFLVEVASREFMDNLVSILKMPSLNLDVKSKALKLIQDWAMIFEGKHNLPYVGQVYSTLKSEGFSFPPQDRTSTSSAMASTQTAPEWIDSDVCLRCRTPFSLTNRKHHCRNCGQVFDQQCSSKSMPLPHFGIAQEVRVCDTCHSKLTKKDIKVIRHSSSSRHRSGRDLADEELQRAIQLSLQEVGAANVNGQSYRPGYAPSYSSPAQGAAWHSSEPPLVDKSTRPTTSKAVDEDENDPELKAAIEASLLEASAPKPSAPTGLEDNSNASVHRHTSYEHPVRSHTYPLVPQYDLEPLESDAILTFSQTVEHVEAEGGRDISRFPAVNELYDKASGLRPKLAMSLDDTNRKEKMLTDMHEKLSQAVKLYDSLLTQQLSRPAWRSNSQPAEPNRHNTVDGTYQQWSASPSQMPPSQDQNNWSQAGASTYPQQLQYSAQYAQPPPSEQTYQLAQQIPSQQTGSSVNTAYQPTRQQSYTAPSIPPQFAPAQVQSPPPPVQQNMQYASPQTMAYQVPIAATSPPAPPQAPMQPVAPPLNSQFAPPSVPQTQSPPLAQYQPSTSVASPPPQPVLSRQNTLTYAPSANGYAPAVSPPSLGPSAQARPQSQPFAPPGILPQFPAVPTSNFAPFPVHSSSVPSSGFEQSEQKEALLIDL